MMLHPRSSETGFRKAGGTCFRKRRRLPASGRITRLIEEIERRSLICASQARRFDPRACQPLTISRRLCRMRPICRPFQNAADRARTDAECLTYRALTHAPLPHGNDLTWPWFCRAAHGDNEAALPCLLPHGGAQQILF